MSRWRASFVRLVLIVVLVGMVPPAATRAEPPDPPPSVPWSRPGSVPSLSALPTGTVVTPGASSAELDRAPAEADALVVDQHNPHWLTRYGSEAARQQFPPRRAAFPAAPSGPEVTLGHWRTVTFRNSTASVTSMAAAPDGRLFMGTAGEGLRVYAPGADGIYTWSTLTAATSGLASDTITALAVLYGELWVGTGGAGLSVLNLSSGVWRTYTAGNSPLPSNAVRRLTAVEPPTGTAYLWVSTSAGAARYRPTRQGSPWLIYTTVDGLPNNDVNDVAVQYYGETAHTWFSTAAGLVRQAGTNWTSFFRPTGCPLDRASRLMVDHDNAVWLGAEQQVPGLAAESSVPQVGYWVPIGVCRYQFSFNSPAWSHYTSSLPGLPGNNLSDMSVDSAGRVWMGFNGGAASGAAVYDQGSWGIYKTPATPLYKNEISAVLAAGEAVWFGHWQEGAVTVHSPNWQLYTAATLGGTGAPGPILIEATTTWIGLGSGVAARVPAGGSYSAIPGNSAAVSALTRGGDGLLWIGTAGNGLFLREGASNYTHHTTADGLPSNEIRAFLTDQEGRTWVATAGGLALRANGYWLRFTQATSPLPSDDLRALALDGTGRIWIGTATSGIAILDPGASGDGAWSAQTTAEGLPSNEIRALAADPSGAIWAGTAAGTAVWSPPNGTWTTHVAGESNVPGSDVLSVTSDPVGRIWVGSDAGLFQREATAWGSFHVSGSTMGSDRVNALGSDGARLWVSAGPLVAARGVITSPIGNFAPVISSLGPSQGAPLTTVIITGNHFDDRGPSFNEVRFCCFDGPSGTPAPQAKVMTVTRTSMAVEVPLLVQDGKITVKANGLTGQSSTNFTVVPVISSLSKSCLGVGDVLEINGRGFFGVGSAAAYVTIGNGPERLADMQDPTLIRQFIRPGDTAGKVRVRLLNDKQAISSESIDIAVPEVTGVAIQQGIESQPMIWGKRTLVQVSLRATGANCAVRIDGGLFEWKLKNNTTRPGSWAFTASPDGLVVPTSAQPVSVNTTVNFVAEFLSNRSQWSELFPLAAFNGGRITLKNGQLTLLTLDLPASAFDYIDTKPGRRAVIAMKIAPSNYSGIQHQEFWSKAVESLAHVARAYPQQDVSFLTNWGEAWAWLGWTPIWHSWNSVDLSDESDDYGDIRDAVDDYLDPNGDWQAMGLIAEELYEDGPSGKATLGHPTSVTFNMTGRMAQIWLQESIHALDWVDEDAPNHDDGNEYHSRYDEGEWDEIEDCNTNLTFRQALVDQTGATRRVVRLDRGDPYQFSLVGCKGADQPRSAMSYVPGDNDTNTFLEPVDFNFVLAQLCLRFDMSSPGFVKSICPGYAAPTFAGQGLPANVARHWPALTATPVVTAASTLRLAGSVDLSDNVTVTLSYLLPGEEQRSAPDPRGVYHLQLRAADDTLLYDHPFEIERQLTHQRSHGSLESRAMHGHGDDSGLDARARFNLGVPFPDGAVKAELRHGHTLLWSRSLSANAPAVSIITPAGGIFEAAGIVPVAWSGSDPDGDPLQFALDYSPDNGQSWITLVPYLTEQSFDWQPDFVPSSDIARLRVRASDGFRTAVALSEPFVLKARAPYATITHPLPGQSFTEGQTMMLAGGSATSSGYDLGAFEWRRGATLIGTEREISYTLSEVGIQTFQLLVTANDLTATEQVTVTVLPDYDRDGLPNEWELSHEFNPLDPTNTLDDPDSDGLSNQQEYQLGVDPMEADTDHDGADDGTEVQAGTGPDAPEQTPATQPVLNVGAHALGFDTAPGDPAPLPWKVWVTNGGSGVLTWSATSDATWLGVSPAAGQAPTELVISADPTELAAGVHTGHVSVHAPGVEGSPHVITVTLSIEGGEEADFTLYLPLLTR